jgi:aminoglycoside phosphotransferase
MVTFDILKFYKEMSNAGMEEKQAITISKELQEIFNQNSDHLATKSDIREVKMELKGEIHLLRWMIGFVMAAIVASLIQHNFIH